jgi:natural product biosynthesis luciferase-like monooxygenase protein
VARYEPFWVRRLSRLDVAELPQVDRTSVRPATHVVQDLSKGGTNVVFGVALVAAYLARVTGRAEFDVGLRVPAAPGDHAIFSDRVPLHLVVDLQQPLHTLVESITQQLESVRKRGTFALDAVARFPQLAGLARDPGKRFPIVLDLVDQVDSTSAARGADLTVGIAPDGTVRLVSEGAALSLAEVRGIARQIEQLAAGVAESATRAVGDQPMLTEAELRTVLREWNDTRRDFEETGTIDGLFAEQALRTPDRTALVHRGDRLTYRQLSERAGLLAHHLRGLGVGPDTLVGVCVERSIDLVVAVLGVLKAGGAYVPLDPSYPKDRVAYMIADAGAPVLIAEGRRIPDLPAHNAQVVAIDGAWRNADVAVPQTGSAGPDNLAYVIYTSGSTGRPKGVMVEHRNVLNFFAGMDDRVGADEPGTWLAVTSLSFDISVLELLWTLARGFEVVIHSESDARTRPVRKAAASGRPLDFSFFYFAADAGEGAGDKYRLLLEGARFADRNGFSAVWTPERHFHAFGGLYPNPAVTGAALAAVTERVQIRGGSVVLPLHHPIRVAEEWSVVDNISRGRVGIAFASGWQPNDFVLRPESFGDQKKVLLRDIDVVRRLWRGETLTFPGPKGDVEVRTLPRPIQPELPFWITTAGNPDTFEAAGRVGANILTHLLGQTVEELGEKLAAYRRAWKEAGHAGDGHVSLMLHAFVGEDNDRIREIVRGPLTSYLRTAAGLIRQFASSFPAFKKLNDVMDADAAFRSLSEEEMEALLAHSFERYYETSGLLGPLEKCLEMCERIQAVGVDEIACLIDFGVDHELVLSHLADLDQVRAQSQASVELSVEDYSVGAQIRRHAVTHMQCTPSMAAMLASDPDTRVALAGLKVLMVGGEAFPTALAQDLASLVRGAVINMYGPTETTIWSSTHHVSRDESAVPIGRPIANTSFYVLDARRHPVPIGVPGELYIGGAGVVRGYLNRPELTAERFVADPFANGSGGRLYRTGDLVRYRGDGNVDFLGRIDHQVKIRGYRVELGEIETLIASWDGIREAAVVLREDTEGDKRLVAYYAPTATARIDADALREHLRGHLPEFMVPSHLVELEELPRTPNGKLDRAALPAPKARRSTAEAVTAPPADDTERVIAEIWCSLLDIPEVGVHDNFFDLGGHSLLVVQAHRRLRDTLKVELSLTDLFRFPTIRALSRHLVSEPGSSAADVGLDRAEARKRSMQRRGRTRA